ncbi:hypothetical protein T492DRAFT_494481 [Pavlovales sp. CCMP2436]|nr:hypothetical protein T492DRAFT_494481 [Pavlovales sp. CCMP2436]
MAAGVLSDADFTRLILEEEAAFFAIVPAQPHVISLTSDLARLRLERNKLAAVDAEYRWVVERTPPPHPESSAVAAWRPLTPSVRAPPRASPPYATTADVSDTTAGWPRATGPRPQTTGSNLSATFKRGASTHSSVTSNRAARDSRRPPSTSGITGSPVSVAQAETRALVDKLKRSTWVVGEEAPAAFYLSHKPQQRTFECNESVNVDGLRLRANGSQSVPPAAPMR